MNRVSILNYLLKFATNAVLTVQAVQELINNNKNKLLENIYIVGEVGNYRQQIYIENQGANISNVKCEENFKISLIINDSSNINISNTNLDTVVKGDSNYVFADSIVQTRFLEANVSKANISKAASITLQQSDMSNCIFENLNSDAIVLIKEYSKLSDSKINSYELSISNSTVNSSELISASIDFYKTNFFRCNMQNAGNKTIEGCIFSDCKISLGLDDQITNVRFNDCYVFVDKDENPKEQLDQISFLLSTIYCNFSNFIYFVNRNKYKPVDIRSLKIGGNTIILNDSSSILENPFKNFVYIDQSSNYYIFTSESEQDVININNEFADINDRILNIANPDNYPKEVWMLLEDYKLITYNGLIFDF